ncbi:DNA ligase D [Paenibacillus sp. J5C_2022]|uniref:DNA ligase D n=1 Tax=Paenibacillus sp. J5C2022 TaxID=2977129 RepID=UPI0021D398A3|nr:DNA ligase D [Paenibacillus sp. J5C2022]MCU6711383.1 DNA ligase D [Paenibacillus sp. J5C2022]
MTKKLSEYNQKRNFERTLEPEGKIATSEEGLKFVVQHHMARREHYDLRLEWEGVLLSWAVPKGPSYNPHDRRLAVMVEDHPLEYRNFEGTIPKGQYGGGVVMLWDEGIWEPYSDVENGLQKGELKFVLRGKRLRGKWVLVRWHAKSGEEKDNWLLMKEKDEYVQTDDGISEFGISIRTGRTMAEIEAGEEEKFVRNPFSKVEAQLAKSVQAIPGGEDWLYEMKYDGYRIIAFVEGNDVRLLTRNGNDYAKRFHDIASALVDLAAGRAMVLDGEVAITDESGKTDFQALQNYLKNPKARNLTYIVFDLLALDGEDLRSTSLTERKERLESLLQNAPGNLYYSRHIRGSGKESFAAACEAGMEGIIGKKAGSLYSGTRTGDWIKLKCDRRQEFVIGGYALSDKKTSGISSLLLGVYEDGELVYAGRAGTGMSEADVLELAGKFEQLKRETTPFRLAPKSRALEKLIWLEPELVAEIKFAEWTKEHQLRQASFKGLRLDKEPREIKREEAEEVSQPQAPAIEVERSMMAHSNSIVIEGIPITNPDKVLFDDPEITKEDVIRYYAKVAGHMLPYASRRILTLVRCPKGISQACFYKKHPGPDNKGIVTIPITTGSGKREDYFYIENSSGFIAEAQMGTLEFHIWGSRIDELEKPDMMVFDLDPDEGMDLGRVRQGARDMKSVLDELSLHSYLKTSGGKGYHVVVPFQSAMTWDQFHDFARQVAQVMEQKWPDRYTSNVRKANRAGKIFIDWIRNGRGATSIAPYSIRARKGGKVSMPILWDELDTVAPDGVNMADALLRIGGSDPWKDFFRDR